MPPSTPAKEGVPAEDAVAETAPLVAEPAAATKTDDERRDVDAAAAAASCKDWETPISIEFTGNVHPLVINLNKDVGDLQAKVQTATGATPDAQCLTVEGGDGQPLEDGTQKLSECVGLESGALVHLTMQDEEQGKARREEREGEAQYRTAEAQALQAAAAARREAAAKAASRREELGLPPTATDAECEAEERKRACCGSAPALFRWATCYASESTVCLGIVMVASVGGIVVAVIFWSTWGKWVAVAAAACVGLACCVGLAVLAICEKNDPF